MKMPNSQIAQEW